MSVIQVNRVTKDYGGGRGVFDLSLAVERGEAFGFLGPNGAGKTTTLRCLMGFIRPDSGACSIKYMPCYEKRAQIQEHLGYIPGEIAFPDGMTGRRFLSFTADYRGLTDRTRMHTLCDALALDADVRIRKMSKGTKQKVGIVCALMHSPDILLLDEPTDGLDPLMQHAFTDLLGGERARGATILMSSHNFEEIERVCGRVGIIKNGCMAAVDDVETLKHTRVKTYRITLDTPEHAQAFAKDISHVESVYEDTVTLRAAGSLKTLIARMNEYPVTDIQSREQGLEETFLQYYGTQEEATD